MFSHLNKATAYMMLKIISSQKTEKVSISYEDYRTVFSIVQVPAELIRSPDGTPRLALVNTAKSVNYLKRTFKFLSKDELTKELEDAASDFSRGA